MSSPVSSPKITNSPVSKKPEIIDSVLNQLSISDTITQKAPNDFDYIEDENKGAVLSILSLLLLEMEKQRIRDILSNMFPEGSEIFNKKHLMTKNQLINFLISRAIKTDFDNIDMSYGYKIKYLPILKNPQISDKPIIICDIQPSYKLGFNKSKIGWNSIQLNNLINKLNNFNNRIFIIYNSQHYQDILSDIKDMYLSFGLSPDKLKNIVFIEKGFSFLRKYYKDFKIKPSIIIEIMKYMLTYDLSTSFDIEDEDLKALSENNVQLFVDNPILLGDNINMFKLFNNYELCGGREDECIKDTIMVLEALEINISLLKEFIY